jgi:hypothetical protein
VARKTRSWSSMCPFGAADVDTLTDVTVTVDAGTDSVLLEFLDA